MKPPLCKGRWLAVGETEGLLYVSEKIKNFLIFSVACVIITRRSEKTTECPHGEVA